MRCVERERERNRGKEHTRGHAWAPVCIPAPPSAAAPNPWSSWYPPISRPSPSRLPILIYTTAITEGTCVCIRIRVHEIWVQNKTPLKCVFTFGLKIGPHQAWGLVCQIRRSITLSGDGQDFAGHWCHIRATSFFHTWDPDPYVRSILVQSLALDQKVNSILGFLGFGP